MLETNADRAPKESVGAEESGGGWVEGAVELDDSTSILNFWPLEQWFPTVQMK